MNTSVTDWLSVVQRHVHADHRAPPAADPVAEVDFVAERAFWKQLLAADPVFQQQVSLVARRDTYPPLRIDSLHSTADLPCRFLSRCAS